MMKPITTPSSVPLSLWWYQEVFRYRCWIQKQELHIYDGAGLVLLAKYPQTFYLLLEGGIELHEIIIGGMGARENRKVLYKNICASDEELEVLKKLYHSGISVKIQIVPEEKGIPLDTLL